MEKLCSFTVGNNWTANYYTQKLEPNATTSSLFAGDENNIQIKKELGGVAIDESKLVNFDILIYAESCGAEKGETYEKAWGLS